MSALSSRNSIGGWIRRTRHRPGIALILAGASLALSGAQAQRRPQIRVLGPIPKAVARARAPEDPEARRRARELLQFHLRKGIHHPHMGEQTTVLYLDRVHESHQILKYAGPGRWRLEYDSPPDMRGEVILVIGGRMFHYKPPPENHIQDGIAPQEALEQHIRESIAGMRNGDILVRAVGDELIAGRQAAIVEIRPRRPNASYVCLWIDLQTGIRLKHEIRDAHGVVRSSTWFTHVVMDPVYAPGEFMPNTLPPAPHVPLLPDSPALASVRAAQSQVRYAIREPAVPEGFRLSGVWVVTGALGATATILRYTDGVNSFVLYEVPAPLRTVQNGFKRPNLNRGMAHWMSGGLSFALIGSLKRESMRSIVDSLQ